MGVEDEKIFANGKCDHCGSSIEFEVEHNGLEATCPYCQNVTSLIHKIPPPILPKQTAKPPMSASDVISILCIIGFVLWTCFCGFGAAYGLFALAQSEHTNPVLTSNNQYARAGGTLGFAVGMGIWFGIWLAGAVPTFMVFIFAKLSGRK